LSNLAGHTEQQANALVKTLSDLNSYVKRQPQHLALRAWLRLAPSAHRTGRFRGELLGWRVGGEESSEIFSARSAICEFFEMPGRLATASH